VRLLVVSQYFWPETFRVNDLVAGLTARGHSVTVLTGRPNYPEGRVFEDYRRDHASFSTFAGAEVLRVPLRPRGKGGLRLILNYWSFVFWGIVLGPWLLRKKSFDAIFFFEISPITGALPAILYRWLKRAPLAMWVLDLWPETLSAVGVVRGPRLLGLVGRLVAFIYRRCDLILAQSRSFIPSIARWAGPQADIRYFPGWAEALFAGDLDAVLPAEETLPYEDTFNVMFAGNIGTAQDFPAILDAADRLKHRSDIRWLIVGDGRAADEVRSEIGRRGLEDRVILLGKHPIDRMPSFFKAASALLVSLKDEPIFALTIPGKVQSYLAAGIPILGMLNGEGGAVIEEAGAGLVGPAGDGEALARNVEQLAAMPVADRAAMGGRGRAFCTREFDRDMLIDRLVSWLETQPRGVHEEPRACRDKYAPSTTSENGRVQSIDAGVRR
jgi:colanic acid biosynthesis glycosyl transferase WcaI